MSEQEMRGEILALVRAYCEKYHAPKEDFSPGDRLPYAARVYDHEEMENLVASALEFWLTAGHYTEEFERGLAAYLGLVGESARLYGAHVAAPRGACRRAR